MCSYLTVQHENRKGWISDITNQKFGHLTALRPTEQRKSGAVVWECQCDCEETTIVYRTTGQLKKTTDHNLHCGCRDNDAGKLEDGKIADITNQKFGFLIALRPTSERADGGVIWECRCKCGEIIHRSVSSLKTGNENQSCGCRLAEMSRENLTNNFHFIDGTRIESIRSQPLLSTNKSGIRGVHFDSHAQKWRAVIYFKGKQIHLGLFVDIEDAAKARKNAEDKYYMPVIEAFEALAQQ